MSLVDYRATRSTRTGHRLSTKTTKRDTHFLSGWPKKSPNFLFTTTMVFPKSLKLMNSGSEDTNLSQCWLDSPLELPNPLRARGGRPEGLPNGWGWSEGPFWGVRVLVSATNGKLVSQPTAFWLPRGFLDMGKSGQWGGTGKGSLVLKAAIFCTVGTWRGERILFVDKLRALALTTGNLDKAS